MDAMSDALVDGGLSRRALAVRLGGGGFAALLLAAATPRTAPAAQDASPAATPPALEGVTAELLASGETSFAPGMMLALRRITLAPGVEIPPHGHLGTHLLVLEAGTWGFTSFIDDALLTRAPAEGTPAPAEGTPVPAEVMPNGTEVILHPGDWVYAEELQDAIRNAGEDDVVFLVATLTPVGEPFCHAVAGGDPRRHRLAPDGVAPAKGSSGRTGSSPRAAATSPSRSLRNHG